MIYRISRKPADKELLLRHRGQRHNLDASGLDFAYRDAIVKKPWGYEYLLFENEHVSIWILQIIRQRKTSLHCHPRKKTALVLLSGNALLRHAAGQIELSALDGALIQKGAFHSTEAFSPLTLAPHSENGIWVMEIESPPLKTDLVRVSDEYGRAGAAYEGVDQMVFESRKSLQFHVPKKNEVIRKSIFDCVFTVRKGGFLKEEHCPSPDALVSNIGYDSPSKPDNHHLDIGRMTIFKDFCRHTKGKDLSRCTILTIEKSQKVAKVSDFVFSFLAQAGIRHVFAVCGGTAMHLVDSLGRSSQVKYIATQHEQGAAMAAEGYSRICGKPGTVLVTSGAGATNTLTGLYGAWVDSIPVIFISGQVTTATLSRNTGLRQFGIEEADIVKLVKPITKYAVTITDERKIKYYLEKALFLATSGRPGPVWLDIPLDIQSKLIFPDRLVSFPAQKPKIRISPAELKAGVAKTIQLLRKAKRPVLIYGYGVRLAGAEKEFRRLLEKLKIPLVSSWTASDLVPTGHEFYIGHSGIKGDRAGNFAAQNADLLLIIGSRMSIPQVGYNYKAFAREAKKIMVDIDKAELKKPSLRIDLPINADAREFIVELLSQLEKNKTLTRPGEWLKRCQSWKAKYPVVLTEYKAAKEGVNSFYFIDLLCEKLGHEAIIVTDMGTSMISTMQAFKTKAGQRLFTSSGHGTMGFGLPGAIGACLASGMKHTICITGDGGLQMSVQELQTVAHYNLPITIFVLNNAGYLTIRLMQQNHFGKYVGSDKSSGLSCPDALKVAQAYGIPAIKITNHRELEEKLGTALSARGAFLCEILMPQDQIIAPGVSSLKRPDGTIVSRPLEDLYPFLSRKEFLENMIVRPMEVLKE